MKFSGCVVKMCDHLTSIYITCSIFSSGIVDVGEKLDGLCKTVEVLHKHMSDVV